MVSVLEKKANVFRNQLGLGSDTSIRLKSILTQLNVITVFKPLGGGFSGMAIKVNQGKDVNNYLRFILVNSNHSLGKQHFTICHELYHLFIQENFTAQTCITGIFNSKDKDKEEYNADLFASFLLMPESGIINLIPDKELAKKGSITIRTILKLEHFFGCSRSALLYRLFSLKLITPSQYDEFKVNVKRSAYENGFLVNLYENGNHHEFIGDYGSIARELYEENKLSESHYYKLISDLSSPYESLKTNKSEFDEEE